MSQDFFYPPGSSSTVIIPPGGATAANQVIQIAEETAIAASVASIDTKTPTVGQKTMALSSPVVIASDQSAVAVSGPLTDTQLRASPVPVSAASLPLPSGAATAANQATQITAEQAIQVSVASIDTKTPALGQAVMASSSPVVIASNQSAIHTIVDSSALPSGAATEATLSTLNGKVISDSSGASGAFSGITPVDLNVSGLGSVIVQLTAAAVAWGNPLPNTIQFYASNDGSNFYPVYANDLLLADGQLYLIANNAGFYSIPCSGFLTIRLIGGTGTSYAIRGSKAANSIFANQAVQFVSLTGTNSIKVAPNTVGTIVNTSLTATTASSASAPANAVGFCLEAPSTNTDPIRYAVGSTASTTVGMLLEPGRDSNYIPLAATISICSTVSGTNAYSIQWVSSS